MNWLDLSICVVLYRSNDVARRFHQELLASLASYGGWQLSYYDNSPNDQLRSLLNGAEDDSRLNYTHDSRNLGFSYANNCLILQARHQRVLLLNPDVFGFSRYTWDLIASVDTTQCVRFARLLNADGTFQDCVGEPSSLTRALSPVRDYSTVDRPMRVGMGIMAFMLTDKSVYARVGLLDCDYPLYSEDMDWCQRANRAGIPTIYDPRIELTHIGGASSKGRWRSREAVLRKYAAEAVFVDKHFSHVHWALMRLLNAVKRVRARFRA